MVVETKKYIADEYRQGKAVFAVTQGDEPGTQTIEISCHNYKLDSFWSGEWLTTWTV